MAAHPKIVVVGAGIIGASIAWHMARRGTSVTMTAGLDLPIDDPAALLVGTRPHVLMLRGLVMTPQLQLRQARDGRFVVAAGLEDTDLANAASRTFNALADLFRPPLSVAPDFQLIGRRPIPGDGLPLVGRADEVPGLYVAVTHSGVTLAPIIDRLVADEIMSDRRDGLLVPFGLGRTRRSWSRRSVATGTVPVNSTGRLCMRQLILTAVAVLAVSLPEAVQAQAPVTPSAQNPVREITKIAGEVHRFRNSFHYSVFAVTPAGIIATDPSTPRRRPGSRTS